MQKCLVKIIVAVIMSTYNGELYLKDQIESILSQKGIDVKLYVRDDGSIDRTPEILEEYASRCPNFFYDNPNDRKNLGIKDSFLGLLKKVEEENPEISYFAFSDQDDIWKEEKLQAAVNMLQKNCENNLKPQLYYSNKIFVDKDLNTIGEEHIKYYGDIFEIFWPSLASGCTMVFNRKTAEYAVRLIPNDFFLHDSWVYRLIKSCDSEIVFDEQSYILYRQHDRNTIGMDGVKLIQKKGIMKRLLMEKSHSLQNKIQKLISLGGEYISEEHKKALYWILTYNKNLVAWFHLAFSPMAFCRGPKLYVVWLAKLLIHRL